MASYITQRWDGAVTKRMFRLKRTTLQRQLVHDLQQWSDESATVVWIVRWVNAMGSLGK